MCIKKFNYVVPIHPVLVRAVIQKTPDQSPIREKIITGSSIIYD
jgi:hypothetical protein